MTTALQFSINFSPCQLHTLHGDTYRKPITFRATKVCTLHHSKFKLRVYKEKCSFLVEERWKDEIFLRKNRKRRGVLLLAVVVPIVGIGAFLWWAGRDIVQDTCPNCGNEFQIFKSTMQSDLQFCPFCTQPFSIVDNKFVRDSVKFSNQSTTFGEAFSDFTRSRKEKKYSSKAVVDVEAEIKDAD
ncbi:hypothetical protein F8388_011492 [Cannabis sativa]|uniref:Uncharacterized protein n=1 Tax=Cannabis sativa TaxID=3483 RepID=A0A7J6G6N7_CANSA|nr:hypothetical protein F8388_011492 [Cannabis sativa]